MPPVIPFVILHSSTDTAKHNLTPLPDPDVTAIPDLSQTRIRKLNPASDDLELGNIGEHTFEAETNGSSLTVEDVTGEYAILAPEAVALPGKRFHKMWEIRLLVY